MPQIDTIVYSAVGAWAVLGTVRRVWPTVRPLAIMLKNRILHEERFRIESLERRAEIRDAVERAARD